MTLKKCSLLPTYVTARFVTHPVLKQAPDLQQEETSSQLARQVLRLAPFTSIEAGVNNTTSLRARDTIYPTLMCWAGPIGHGNKLGASFKAGWTKLRG